MEYNVLGSSARELMDIWKECQAICISQTDLLKTYKQGCTIIRQVSLFGYALNKKGMIPNSKKGITESSSTKKSSLNT